MNKSNILLIAFAVLLQNCNAPIIDGNMVSHGVTIMGTNQEVLMGMPPTGMNISRGATHFAKIIDVGQRNGQYCAKMKDGILVMVSEQKEITQEIILANGTIIKPDGNIIRKDGTSIILEDEECVDSEGNKVKAKAKDKTEMEEEWRPPLYK